MPLDLEEIKGDTIDPNEMKKVLAQPKENDLLPKLDFNPIDNKLTSLDVHENEPLGKLQIADFDDEDDFNYDNV